MHAMGRLEELPTRSAPIVVRQSPMGFRRHVTTALTATAPSTAGLTGSRPTGVCGSSSDTCVPDRQRGMRSTAGFLLRASLLVVWSLLDVSGFRLVLVSGWHGALILGTFSLPSRGMKVVDGRWRSSETCGGRLRSVSVGAVAAAAPAWAVLTLKRQGGSLFFCFFCSVMACQLCPPVKKHCL